MTIQCPFLAHHLATPDVIVDPFPAYAALRKESPVFGYADVPPGAVPGGESPSAAWAFLTFDDVVTAATNYEDFSSVGSAPGVLLVDDDPPTHTRLRKLTEAVLTADRVLRARPVIDKVVADALIRITGKEVDAIAEIAAPVAAKVAAHFFGLDDSFPIQCRRWGTALMLSGPVTAEEHRSALNEMVSYFSGSIGERLAKKSTKDAKTNNVIDALFTVVADGERFSQEEILGFCLSHIVSGVDTVMYLLGNALAILCERPGIFSDLRDDPTKISRFRDELLRFCGPAQRMYRSATRDVVVSAKQVKTGDRVALFFGSANRDPRKYFSPDEFHLDRFVEPPHVSYGVGIHRCPGSDLANYELESLVSGLVSRFKIITPGEARAIRQATTLLQNGYLTLPLRFGA